MDRGDIFITVAARDQVGIFAQHIFYHRQSDTAGSGHVTTDTQIFFVQLDAIDHKWISCVGFVDNDKFWDVVGINVGKNFTDGR